MQIKMSDSGAFFDGQDGLAEGFNKYLAMLSIRGLSQATSRAYAFDLLSMYRWLRSNTLSIWDIDQSALLGFISFRQKQGASPRTINRELITIRNFCKFFTGCELKYTAGSASVAGYYKGSGRDKNLGLHRLRRKGGIGLRVKTPKTLIEPLSKEDVCKFLGSLRKYRDIAIVHSMLFCGLRSGEVLKLRTYDVDAIDRKIRVSGKGGKHRQLPLPEILLDSLSDYQKYERPQGCFDKTLFVVLQGSRRGQGMTPAGLRSLFRYRREHFNLTLANAHRFRHTFGADMARSGVRLPILQKMMGHSNSVTTLGYINLSMSDIAQEYLRASQAIKKKYGLYSK